MSAQLLRDAADRLETLTAGTDRAGSVIDGEPGWYPERALLALGMPWVEDAAYIAAMSPTVGKALAAWLRDVYPFMACDNCTSAEARCHTAQAQGAIACCPECSHARRALAVARAVLGGDA